MSKTPAKILIVDDNKELLIALKFLLNPHFEEIRIEKNPNLIPSIIEKENFDLIVLDMNFSAGINTGNEGLFWMNKILEFDADATIVLITAYGDIELAVKAIKDGATDFIHKSWDGDKILSTLLAAYQLSQKKQEIKKLKNKQKYLTDKIINQNEICIGNSERMSQVYSMVEKVANTDANILILGQNGTGKEVIAKEIHRLSKRKNDIFLAVDLGAVTETLFETELFGYVKGAYTDAKTDKASKFELASGGTLFLDEIGNLSITQQSKLLSVIQNKEITRVGSNQKTSFEVRLICATNKDLHEMVKQGLFREDLLYRINTIQIELPSLYDRISDIPYLSEYFLNRFTEKYKKNLKLSKQAIEKLCNYKWPGNIRELKHTIEKAVILADSNVLTEHDFIFKINDSVTENNQNLLNLDALEKQTIERAIEISKGNLSTAAQKLGINRTTLYNKIKKYGLE